MEAIEYGRQPTRRTSRLLLWGGVVLIACGVVYGVANVSKWLQGRQSRAAAGPSGLTLASTSASTRFDADAVFAARVRPVLDTLRARDDDAVRQAAGALTAFFEQAKTGAPAFAEDLIGPLDSAKTGYLAGKGLWVRWWYSDPAAQPVRNHVQWNYEREVTSGPQIRDEVLRVVSGLEQAFRSNRNDAVQAITSSLKAGDLPATIGIDRDQLDAYCQNQLLNATGEIGSSSGQNAAAGTAVSTALGTVTTIIVERAVTAVIAGAAVKAGGSVLSGAGTGTAIGSVVPGAGTAIGAAAGLLSGVALDMWLGSRNKAAVVEQVNASLNQLSHAILHGDGQKDRGLLSLFQDAATGQVEFMGQRLKAQLQEAAR